MKIGKNMIIAVMITFCFTATLFLVIPISSANTYDPWVDVNDDGKIGLQELSLLAKSYNTAGTPINKTALLLELQSEVDSLNSSVLALQGLTTYLQNEVVTMRVSYDAKFAELQTTMNTLNATITELQSRNTELENRVSILEILQGLPINWSNGLVGYWKLDEGNGTTAGDSSGNNNNGTLENGPIWVSGKYGEALSFDGNAYVTVPDSYDLRVQNFSLEAWIFMTKRPYQHGTSHSAIINKLHYFGSSGSLGYKLQFENPTSTNDNLVISIGDGAAQIYLVNYNSIVDLTLNQWHHVVGTYDGNTAKIYIDGELKSSSNPGMHTIVHDDAPLAMGTEVTGNGVQYNGLIDNVMIYNRALSEEEVLSHYLLPPP